MSERGRQLSSTERRLFAEFFAKLEAAGIVALLLRNYEDFPASIGHDLDVFFRRGDVPQAVGIFREVLRASGGEVLHIHERDYVLAVWFRAALGEPQAIHLDFYHGAYTWHGLSYVSEDDLVAGSRGVGGFQGTQPDMGAARSSPSPPPGEERAGERRSLVSNSNPLTPTLSPLGRGEGVGAERLPASSCAKFNAARPAHEALNMFLTSVLWGGFYKVRYAARIATLLQDPAEATEFFRLLEREFGTAGRPPVDLVGGQEPAPTAMSAYARQLRRAFKLRSLLRSPLGTAFRLSRYWLKELGTLLAPPGICLAFLGPDGSGKSTVIQAVKERVEYYFGEVEDRHWRPQFLRDVGVLLGKREQTSGPVSDPHGQPPHSLAVSALRFFYYWLDYWLGYPLRVWKYRAKNHLVIFDRYAPDMWCDPKRYRLGLPVGLMKFFCRLVPQPELTFVLLADAEIIHQRKGEVPLATLRELLQRYGEAARQGSRVHAVNCNRPVDQIADEIAAVTLARLQAKVRKDRRFR